MSVALVARYDIRTFAFAACLAIGAKAVDVKVQVDFAGDTDLVRTVPGVHDLVLVEQRAVAFGELHQFKVAGQGAHSFGGHVHAHLVRNGFSVSPRRLAFGKSNPLRDSWHHQRGQDGHDGDGNDQLDQREGSACVAGRAAEAVGSHGFQ